MPWHIMPLDWQDRDGFSLAFVGFGHYEVREYPNWHLIRPRGCYGKMMVKCRSLADGKRLACAHYFKTMKSNLCPS